MCTGFPDCPEWGAGEERSINVLLIQRSEEKLLCRLHCQLGLSCLKVSGFAMRHWHEMKAKLLNVTKTVAILTQKKCCPFHAHVMLLLLGAPGCGSVEIGCTHRAWCSALKSWHWSSWSPGSSTAISAGQSTLASFLDAALILQIPLCLAWRACLFRAVLGSLHDAVRGSYQVYSAQTESCYFANSHLWTFCSKKIQFCDNASDVRRRPAPKFLHNSVLT